MIASGGIYRHFKGDYYLIISVAEHVDTGKKLVIYKALYEDGKVYARDLEEFESEVPKGRHIPTGQKYRFEKAQPPRLSEYTKGD